MSADWEPDADGKIRISWLMPTEEQIREQVRTMLEGPPVYCRIVGYPPLPDERSWAYHARVYAALMREAFPPKRSLWQRPKDRFA